MFNKNYKNASVFRLQLLLWVSMLFFGFASVTQANFEADWFEQFGGSGSDDAHDVAADSSGNTYVVGSISTALPGEVHSGLSDAYIRKYDSEGNILWTDQFGTTLSDRSVSVAVNGAYVVVVGVTDGALPGQTNIGDRDVFIRTYEHNGTLVLNKQTGSSFTDEARAVAIEDNYLYLTGYTHGTLSGQTSSGGVDAFVQKIHLTGGAVIWTHQFGTASPDQGFGVVYVQGGIYVLGITQEALPGFTNQGSTDVFVRKYDTNGNELWTDQFGTTGYDLVFDAVEQGGYVYIVGDVDGELTGQTEVGGGDAFIRKYDPTNGSVIWTDQFGTIGLDEAYAVTADNSGVYVAGFVEGSLSGQQYFGNFDVYVRKYDFSGNELFTGQSGTSGGEDIFGLSIGDGHVYVVGGTEGSWPGETSAGGNDAYLIRLSQDSDGDGVFDEVDTNVSVASSAFDDGVTYGNVVTSGDQVLSIKDSVPAGEGVYVVADPAGGPTQAEISACGISTFYLDAGDTLTITCGSVTFDVVAGSVTAILIADDGRVAESTVSSGNTLTFEAVAGTVSAPVTNIENIVVTAGNEVVTVTPGVSEEMPSDLPITVDSISLSPSAIAIGDSTTLVATVSSPSDEVSTITGVTYWVNDGSHNSAVAADGAYDEATESIWVDLGAFTVAGVYEVCVTATDNVANGSETGCTILAVYDPNGGYVTGGGQIDSPAGAYVADTSLTGKAHFGFIAEYENGAQTPTGNTQFRFHAGSLKFKSDSYDWLVVAGARAQYKGYGSIGKDAGYRFMLTAIDGNLLGQGNGDDKFRMKIWNDATGDIVYDNQLGSSDSSNPQTTISHGSIVIHNE